MKPDCYKCKHQGTVPGNAHSCCRHPKVAAIGDDPIIQAMGILGSVGRVPAISVGMKELGIKANPRGIKNNWFIFPTNFDPLWLEECNGFKPEDKYT